ncbi:MAG: MotA/TolQ/ExbB proton channel family protein [Phycisphaerales bacterium]|nr:MotA/TolQ/ExbB proton channel family protein [Phycisphaerales bacterium]
MIDMIEMMLNFFVTGGWVMYPLLFLSILSVTLILERALYWLTPARRSGIRKLKQYAPLLDLGDTQRALTLSSNDHSLEGVLVRSTISSSSSASESLAFAHIEVLRPSVDRFATTLATIIAVSPLLGILGTVTGIIQSFDLLGDAATVSDPTIVAGGIAEALYTTAFGLTIALVTIFPHMYFRAKAEQTLSRLETLASMFKGTKNA